MTTYPYAISSSDQAAPVKIGKTGNLANRLRQLQTASPVPLRVWWSRETTDPALETRLHRHFAGNRMSGEWFKFDEANWLEQLDEAVELLEQPQANPVQDQRATRAKVRRAPSPHPFVTHGHRPPGEGVPELSRDGAGTDLRCLCGHPITLHCGAWPYSCTSTNTGWNCHDHCECQMFRSNVSWSLKTWLAYAPACQRCQAAPGKDPGAELWSAKDQR
ncbi:GIY-YIG nuclease family protein [Streptomyces sp. NPDC127172]|uniref:GIY-YIG nuclease family protein n=1 Tax=Streptomyces sp. NPDC127172 TaxID=3345382 RepID=UPI003637B630